MEQLHLCATATETVLGGWEPQLLSPGTTATESAAPRSPSSTSKEAAAVRSLHTTAREQPLLAATRGKPERQLEESLSGNRDQARPRTKEQNYTSNIAVGKT